MKYKVIISNSAEKELSKLPKEVILKIKQKVIQLADNPFISGYKQLKGSQDKFYRIRVGNYRIIYSVQNNELIITIIKIGHRREIYD
ncbi:MAG: type II toxin-antitoxin system RelE/ParE family toxin [Spirosomaceae bacterium]|jgi:mRNA interferase RelE/StbE|nr:type II toxin-antitoxin system RelE/ParE family toxin [Spirosomataceae bacterium]